MAMDDEGMDASAYNNVINANPHAAAQEMLDRIDTTHRPDLTSGDIDFLANFSDVYMTESTGISTDELLNLYRSNDVENPTIEGELFWAL